MISLDIMGDVAGVPFSMIPQY